MSMAKGLSKIALSAVFGVVLLGQSADAQPVINSVTVTSPDSNTVLAIGGTVTVVISANEFGAPTNLTALAWLVSDKTNPASVLFDNTVTATVDNLVLGALQANSVSLGADAAAVLATLQGAGGVLDMVAVGSSASGDAPSFIAARQEKTALALDAVFGDANTAAAATASSPDGDDVTYTITLKIPPSAGENLTGVHVAVAVYDPNSNTYNEDLGISGIAIKIGAIPFGVDGDRPAQTDMSIEPVVGGSADGKVFLVYADGTTSGDNTKWVSGFTSGDATRDVAGVGDQLGVDIELDADNSSSSTLGQKIVSGFLDIQVSAYGSTSTVDVAVRTGTVLNHRIAIIEDGLGQGDISAAAGNKTIAAFTVDAAGNQSSLNNADDANDSFADDATATGVTTSVSFVIDDNSPDLSGVVDADDATKGNKFTPGDGEAISDGSLVAGASDDGFKIGGNSPLLSYRLPETMETLAIKFVGSSVTLTLNNDKDATADSDLGDATLGADVRRYIDFSALATADSNGAAAITKASASFATDGEREAVTEGGTAETFASATAGTKLATGNYDIEVVATDMAGNSSAALTASDVTVDVDNIALTRRFPTKESFGPVTEARTDTLNRSTAQVVFQLSEVADSIFISFTKVGTDTSVTFDVPSAQLAVVGAEQKFATADSLVTGTNYVLTIVHRDLAGNFATAGPDTFHFSDTFEPFVIAKFVVDVVDGAGASVAVGLTAANHKLVGTELLVKITATSSDGSAANTFASDAVLTIDGAGSAVVTGTGVEVLAAGSQWSLTEDEWIVGAQTLKLNNTTSIDTVSIKVVTTDTLFEGALDSSIVYNPEVYTAINITTAADTVAQGEEFWVAASLADKYGNTRVLDSRFVEFSSDGLGVQLPHGAMKIDGAGGFNVNTGGFNGWMTITGRDIVQKVAPAGTTVNGGDYLSGSLRVYVTAAGALDAPDKVVAEDYPNDQGGFVILTFDLSDDHGTLSGYRIFRDIAVNHEADSDGAVVAAPEGTTASIPWGVVDAVPGVDVMRVVVATLDGDETTYGVAAERGNETTAKVAFSSSESVGASYELMAQTLQMSREAAQLTVEGGIVQATLTPEALAFGVRGIVPRLKAVGGVTQSLITVSNVTQAVDNIAPEPVAFIRALDTPDDQGGSVTVSWARSPSDRLLSYAVGEAVGNNNTYTTAGVKGYNILRKAGDGAFALVGTAGPGETSFADQLAFNGMRYTYQVEAFDNDNTTGAALSSTAMPIRNSVYDAKGILVRGLFGSDNQVGLDDFFIFADMFGLEAEDKGFDPAFDLTPNNRIDLLDFFVFADHFGRTLGTAGKVVPLVAGLNSDARLYLDAGGELARVGEELAIAVNLEEFVDLKGYGFSLAYDSQSLEFIGTRNGEDNILGESEFARPRVLSQGDGEVTIAAFGATVSEGDLGLHLIFRSLREIEVTFIEVTDGQLRDGNFGLNAIPTPVSVRVETRPEVYALSDNYPNPFNPETTIKYQLPEAGDVRLEVYNMLGQVVTTLVDKQQAAGRYVHLWQGTNDNGNSVGSGIYFYRIQVGGEFQSVRKMLLLK